MGTLLRDVRYALRMLRKDPGFTAIAVLTLALGIGANTAIFSIIYAILLRPLPYPDPSRLMLVQTTQSEPGKPTVTFPVWSYPRFEGLREHNQVFQQVAPFADFEFTLTDTDNPERVEVELTSPAYFSMLGVKPILGRAFVPEEDKASGPSAVVLIGEGLWRRRFGADAKLLGTTIHVNKVALTVVGVLAAEFRGQSGSAELWAPIVMAPALEANPNRLRQAYAFWHEVIARLKPGISSSQAQAAMATVERQIESQVPPPGPTAGWGIALTPLRDAKTDPAIRKSLLILFAAVAFVLLIACVNVANLLLERAATRQREIAIRLAIGSTRIRLMRQLITESLLLAIVAGLVALAIGSWGIHLVAAFQPALMQEAFSSYARLPDFATIRMTWPVFSFMVLISLATGVFFGLVPAFRASRPDLIESLKESPTHPAKGQGYLRRVNARGLLVIAEASLALVLLVGAGLMVESFARLLATQLGFLPQNLLTAKIDLPQSYPEAAKTAFFQELLYRVAGLPGVQSASLMNAVPLTGSYDRTVMTIETPGGGSQRSDLLVGVHLVSPELLNTLRVPLIGGRWISEQDRPGSKAVAVINESAVRKYWHDENPVGQRINLGIGSGPNGTTAEIVGVVGDVKYDNVDKPVDPDVYLSYLQTGYPVYFLVLRTGPPPLSLAGALRHEVVGLDRDVPVYDVATMIQRLADSTSRARFSAFLLTVFAALALSLAAIGLYGVISYSVAQRTHEIGIRMALGAKPRDVLKLVVGQGMLLAIVGVGVGLLGAFALTRFLASMLYSVRPTDPATFMAVSFLFASVALLATYIPARRAAKVDPMVALRYE